MKNKGSIYDYEPKLEENLISDYLDGMDILALAKKYKLKEKKILVILKLNLNVITRN